jgi:hypothetical protein
LSAAALVRRAIDAGVTLRLREEWLVLSCDSPPDAGRLHELRSAKPTIAAYLLDLSLWTAEDWNASTTNAPASWNSTAGCPGPRLRRRLPGKTTFSAIS